MGKEMYRECASINEQCPMNQLLSQMFNNKNTKWNIYSNCIWSSHTKHLHTAIYYGGCQIKQSIDIINISTSHNFFFQPHCSWHYTGYVKHVLTKNFDLPFLIKITTLIPVLYKTIPASSNDFTWFMWVPQHSNAYTVMCLPFLVQLCGFPVPYITLAISIPRYQVAATNQSG
jgi:hypothetical protein